jgi:dolichol-phosphate mannosyltransferase
LALRRTFAARVDWIGETVEIAVDAAWSVVAHERDAHPNSSTSASRGSAPTPVATVFVVPAFNEEANLPRLIKDLERRPDLFHAQSRVIVVDDGSDDGTAAIVECYAGSLPLELVRMGSNSGPGAAFRAGFAAALEDCPEDSLIVTLEADTTSDLDALPLMFAEAGAGADLVLASVHGGGEMVNVSLPRRVLSRGAGAVVRVALGLDARTVSSFFRVYRAAALRRAFERFGDDLIRESGFACKAEILANLTTLGAVVSEVPVDLDGSRRIGASKMQIGPTLAGYGRLVRRRFSSAEASARKEAS